MKENFFPIVVASFFFVSLHCTFAYASGLTPPPATNESTPGLPHHSVNQDTKITSPENNATITDAEMVSGTTSAKNDLWVLIWPEQARNIGWPQSDSAGDGAPAFKKGEKWSVQCYFGGPSQSYEIAVYEATESASKELGDLMKKWSMNNSYPGLHVSRLPDGLTEQHRIKVVKK